MNLLPKSTWRYALLIVVLCAIVAIAAHFIISHFGEQLAQTAYANLVTELSLAIWALTMGCLFLAGALGLWVIRSTTESEGRRRIGRFVDQMDYLSDGLVALDRAGRIIGSNPAARHMAPCVLPLKTDLSLAETFTCLTTADMQTLLDVSRCSELERDCVYSYGLRALRFRSQPSEGVVLVLISDVTDIRSQDIRRRQIAQLQLVGRIAAGMAHDVNNILCSIAAHAALLARGGHDPETMRRSVEIINEETQKGSQLSQQLLALSRTGHIGSPSMQLPQDVEGAAALLRIVLAPAWVVQTLTVGQFSTAPLSSAQIEQVILNLGLLIADAHPQPGTLTITLKERGSDYLLDVGNQFMAVIMVSLADDLDKQNLLASAIDDDGSGAAEHAGVILSVVKSILEQAQARLDRLLVPGGGIIYRVCLPHMALIEKRPAAAPVADERKTARAMTGWRILLGGHCHTLAALQRYLQPLGVEIMERKTIFTLLADVEALQSLDVIVADKRLLGVEADGLIKALRKLYPSVGLMVICDDPRQESSSPTAGVVFIAYEAERQQILQALSKARALARATAAS